MVKKFVWCTDIHLDFLERTGGRTRILDEFVIPLSKVECDGYLITGDISLAEHLIDHLEILDNLVDKPIHFVLGNHDFYGSSFNAVRSQVQELCENSKHLHYMTGDRPTSLTENVALVGDDGWYDAQYGTPMSVSYVMSDWFRIHDYVEAGAMGYGIYSDRPNMGIVIGLSRKFAADASTRMLTALQEAVKTHRTIIILTHVPPWVQMHRYEGKAKSPEAHAWYTSKFMGDVISEFALSNPEIKFEVFCGHTHGKSSMKISHNVMCHMGSATYDEPSRAGTLIID